MKAMTSCSNEIVIVQQQQDYLEPTYTDLKSTINEVGIPNEKDNN
jgi:hypothetical protein